MLFALIVLVRMVHKADNYVIHLYFLSLGIKGMLSTLCKYYGEIQALTFVDAAFPWLMIAAFGTYFFWKYYSSCVKSEPLDEKTWLISIFALSWLLYI